MTRSISPLKKTSIAKPPGAVLFTSLLLFVALITGFAQTTLAANVAVTNTDDSGIGSLRQAITDAAYGDTIVFHVKGTITLTTGQLVIDKNLTIYGGKTDDITISGNNATRIFKVIDSTVIFDSLTIADGKTTEDCSNGNACGGGIAVMGSSSHVAVLYSTLKNNATELGSGDMGGAIYNEGQLTVSDCTFEANTSDHGGAIYNRSYGQVKYCRFLDNTAENGGAGGAYYNGGGNVWMIYSSFIGNQATGSYAKGGAVYSYSTQSSIAMNIESCTFSKNSADYAGGAFYNAEGNSVIFNSTISDNYAHESGGGIRNNGTDIIIKNSTITKNNAGISGGGVVSYGTDAYDKTVATVSNSIISENTVNGTPDDLQLDGVTGDSFVSEGFNLIGTIGPNITAFQDGVNGDQVGINDPKLGPLVDNGGDTFTHLPESDSEAVDEGGDCATAAHPVISDQRGLPRANPCDIGSVELQPARLTVVKNTVGGNGSFDFFTTLPGGDFTIDTTGNTGSKVYRGLDLDAYFVDEDVPDGWKLTAACDNGDIPPLIELAKGEDVTCTFTNTKLATISINKMTFPADGTGFEFSQDIDGSGDFTLGDQGIKTFTDVDPIQSYTVTETTFSGYTLLGLTCSDQDSIVDVASGTATINVDPGENVVCLFTNVEENRVIIEKVTVPAGAPDEFTFSVASSNEVVPDFTLTGGAHQEYENVPAGTYTVTETDPTPGFDLTAIDCNGGDTTDSFTVDLPASKVDFELVLGETVHCAFTNTRRGRIIVDKVTEPAGDVQSFEFVLVGGPDTDIVNQSFALTDAAAPYDSGQIKPGTYSLAETPLVAGWDLSSAQCSDGSTPDDITLDPGETVTCTFTNTKHTSLTVAVTKKSAGSGTVASNPPGIDCGDNCTAEFAGGTTVILTAAPQNGSTFVGWSGACSGTGLCTVHMSATQTVSAEFYKFPWPTFIPATTGVGKK